MNNPIEQASEQLRELFIQALARAISRDKLPACPIPDFSIEIPADPSHGDFATNLAMICAKTFHMAPRAIAEIVCFNIELQGSLFVRFEVAEPGFINAFLRETWFADVVRTVQTDARSYGKSDFGGGKKWMVEFVSANPTGPMHIGNARGGAIGDCLAEVLRWAGYDVTKEFYVNDAGNQIEKFGRSLQARYLQLFLGEDKVAFPEDGYQGADISEHAKAFAEKYGDRYVNASSEEQKKALVAYALPINIQNLKDDLARYRIEFDHWFMESELHRSGLVEQMVQTLKDKGLAYEKEGAVWYRSTEFGCEKDDVLVRAGGTPTYFAADIAYHYHKFAVRGFDRVINIWGADHHGHVARLKGAMDALGLDSSKLDIVLMQMVRLVRNGELVKVSKRSGKSITLVSLLDEIPIDAARFFFNLKEANSHFDFDLDLAVEQGSQNPVYYVQYAHARICSILSKLAQEGQLPDAHAKMRFDQPDEHELIRMLAKFPGEVIQAAKQYNPARLTRYSIDLATLFHKFYSTCKVKGSEPDILQARLNLCDAVRLTLSNVLTILKISAPESM